MAQRHQNRINMMHDRVEALTVEASLQTANNEEAEATNREDNHESKRSRLADRELRGASNAASSADGLNEDRPQPDE